jgi:hypothetical protein
MRFLGWVLVACVAASAGDCTSHSWSTVKSPDGASGAPTEPGLQVAEVVYDGGLKDNWQDSGKAAREVTQGQPAKVRFDNDGDWVLSKQGLSGDYGGIAFREKGPVGEAEFLEIRLDPRSAAPLRSVKISPDHRTDVGDGWTQIVVPMDELNPDRIAFERIVFHAFRPFGTDWVLLDKVALTRAGAHAVSKSAVATGKRAPMRIACDATPTKISGLIYGIAGVDASQIPVDFGAVGHRWGGNGSSRYNWESHVANKASDWFFENHAGDDYAQFLANNVERQKLSALTVPILGWVAKDATSYSFPVSVYGPQGKTDPWHPDAGDGTKRTPSGAKIAPGPQTRTSIPAPPAWVKRWIAAIRANDAKTGKRSVDQYILDNEPMLWSTTHRDVRPDPLGYDELLDRTIQYGTAIREADPDAVIAGPAEWGWSNYFFSGKDAAAGFDRKPDRRAHGDVPLVEWYLRKLHEYEQKSGVRVLDVVDVHYYPQESKVYSDESNPSTAALRLRSTRSLWDPTYVDESWISEPIRLLPRMREWVEKNYPGRGISIGEWNFGGEKHVSGALATAEALGRFAQFGVTSAFYWTLPPAGSPSVQGFLAYRNFDGKGGHFLDWYLPTTTSEGASLFASRDGEGRHVVAIAINMSPDDALLAEVDLGACGPIATRQSYVYMRGAPGFTADEIVRGSAPAFDQPLAPWSITVMDVELANALGSIPDR